jgi:hypothetical protein
VGLVWKKGQRPKQLNPKLWQGSILVRKKAVQGEKWEVATTSLGRPTERGREMRPRGNSYTPKGRGASLKGNTAQGRTGTSTAGPSEMEKGTGGELSRGAGLQLEGVGPEGRPTVKEGREVAAARLLP